MVEDSQNGLCAKSLQRQRVLSASNSRFVDLENSEERATRWHGSLSAKNANLGPTMSGVCPSFRVGVSFRAILLCLILNWLLVIYS